MPHEHATSRNWLHTGYGWDLGVPHPAAYSWGHDAYTEALNEDPAWHAWWRKARRRELWLFPLFTPQPATDPRVRRRIRSVEVVLDVDSACFEVADPQMSAALALEHLQHFVGLAAGRLSLGPMPPWPPLRPVPEDLSEFEFVDETPDRDEMRAIFQEMGVPGDVEAILDGFGYDADGRPPGARRG